VRTAGCCCGTKAAAELAIISKKGELVRCE
jgi:hypothetical protein